MIIIYDSPESYMIQNKRYTKIPSENLKHQNSISLPFHILRIRTCSILPSVFKIYYHEILPKYISFQYKSPENLRFGSGFENLRQRQLNTSFLLTTLFFRIIYDSPESYMILENHVIQNKRCT